MTLLVLCISDDNPLRHSAALLVNWPPGKFSWRDFLLLFSGFLDFPLHHSRFFHILPVQFAVHLVQFGYSSVQFSFRYATNTFLTTFSCFFVPNQDSLKHLKIGLTIFVSCCKILLPRFLLMVLRLPLPRGSCLAFVRSGRCAMFRWLECSSIHCFLLLVSLLLKVVSGCKCEQIMEAKSTRSQ